MCNKRYRWHLWGNVPNDITVFTSQVVKFVLWLCVCIQIIFLSTTNYIGILRAQHSTPPPPVILLSVIILNLKLHCSFMENKFIFIQMWQCSRVIIINKHFTLLLWFLHIFLNIVWSFAISYFIASFTTLTTFLQIFFGSLQFCLTVINSPWY